MIAVVGLLLTTGGTDALLERHQQGTETQLVGSQVGIGERGTWSGGRDISDIVGLSLWSVDEDHSEDTLDARLILLQEQGRTPTASTGEPDAALANMESPSANPASAVETVRGEELRVEDIICSYPWPQGCEYWIEVARCESTLGTDPWAYDIRNPYTGLFQIWEGHGYGYEWLKDNENNILAAWELSDEGKNTHPWPCCQWR